MRKTYITKIISLLLILTFNWLQLCWAAGDRVVSIQPVFSDRDNSPNTRAMYSMERVNYISNVQKAVVDKLNAIECSRGRRKASGSKLQAPGFSVAGTTSEVSALSL